MVEARRVAGSELARAQVVQPGQAPAAERGAVEGLEQARRPLQLLRRRQRGHGAAQRPRARLQHLPGETSRVKVGSPG